MIIQTSTLLLTCLFAGLSWAQQVELNQATEVELDGLRGLGPSLTRQVLSERQKRAFADWSDVMIRIRGIGPRKAASLSAQGLQVEGQEYPASTLTRPIPTATPASQ